MAAVLQFPEPAARRNVRPSFQVYPRDDLTDTALMTVDIAAQGLWFQMRNLAHDGSPVGVLCFGDNPLDWRIDCPDSLPECRQSSVKIAPESRHNNAEITPKCRHFGSISAHLGKRLGLDKRRVLRLLTKLLEGGCLCITEGGNIFYPAMIQADQALTERGQAGAAARWSKPRKFSYGNPIGKNASAFTPTTTKSIHPNPPSEDFSGLAFKTLKSVVLVDDAKGAQKQVAEALGVAGFSCQLEHVVPNRGDGRQGRVDVVASKGDTRLAIEIDSQSPREKSIFKLRQCAGHRVILLRAPSWQGKAPEGFTVICLGRPSRAEAEGRVGADRGSGEGSGAGKSMLQVFSEAYDAEGGTPEGKHACWFALGVDRPDMIGAYLRGETDGSDVVSEYK